MEAKMNAPQTTILQIVIAEYTQHLKPITLTEWDDLSEEQRIEWSFTVGKEMAIAAHEAALFALAPTVDAAPPHIASVDDAMQQEQAFINKIGINVTNGVIVPEGVQTHFMARGH
jgi:hypothetical protein